MGEGGIQWAPGDSPQGLPQAQGIVALWGVTHGNETELAANTTLAEAAVKLAQGIGARRVLHMSSGAVYPQSDQALGEEMRPDPPSPYGKAKVAMEQRIAALRATHPGLSQAILRIGNVAGAESLFANARPGATVTLDRFPDGSGPLRSYIAPADLARVINALLLASDLPDLVNVAAPKPTAMADLARAAGAVLQWRTAPERAIPRVELDTRRLQSLCPLPDTAAEPRYLVEAARASGIWP